MEISIYRPEAKPGCQSLTSSSTLPAPPCWLAKPLVGEYLAFAARRWKRWFWD